MKRRLTCIGMTAVQALLLAREERYSELLLELQLLVRDGLDDAKQLAGSRAIVVTAWSTGLAKRPSRVVVRRQQHDLGRVGQRRVVADDIGREAFEEWEVFAGEAQRLDFVYPQSATDYIKLAGGGMTHP